MIQLNNAYAYDGAMVLYCCSSTVQKLSVDDRHYKLHENYIS